MLGEQRLRSLPEERRRERESLAAIISNQSYRRCSSRSDVSNAAARASFRRGEPFAELRVCISTLVSADASLRICFEIVRVDSSRIRLMKGAGECIM